VYSSFKKSEKGTKRFLQYLIIDVICELWFAELDPELGMHDSMLNPDPKRR
jgi:hypothetical protein